jgi:hypothetical protein
VDDAVAAAPEQHLAKSVAGAGAAAPDKPHAARADQLRVELCFNESKCECEWETCKCEWENYLYLVRTPSAT